MDPNNPYETWQAVIEKVKSYGTVNPAQVDAFLGRMQPQASSVGFLLATVDTDFIKGQIEKRFLSQIEQALRDLFETEYVVEIEVDPGSSAFMQQIATQNAQQSAPCTPPVQPAAPQAAGAQAGAAPITTVHSEPAAPAAQPIQPQPQIAPQVQPAAAAQPSSPQPPAATSHLTGSQIARANGMDTGAAALTFENFIIGDSNRLAYSMAVSVAESPGKSTLNPLFIYGKSGLGKTHLLRAIQNYILETRPDMRVVYIDAQEFITEYSIAAIDHSKDKSSFQAFQSRYLDADALLIDDVQYFQGKSATVNIVFQLFNRLTDAGKQVVLSADRSPKSIDIDERYKSRFNSGGTYDIQPPEVETKLGIIKSFIEEYKRSNDRVRKPRHHAFRREIAARESFLGRRVEENHRRSRAARSRAVLSGEPCRPHWHEAIAQYRLCTPRSDLFVPPDDRHSLQRHRKAVQSRPLDHYELRREDREEDQRESRASRRARNHY